MPSSSLCTANTIVIELEGHSQKHPGLAFFSCFLSQHHWVQLPVTRSSLRAMAKTRVARLAQATNQSLPLFPCPSLTFWSHRIFDVISRSVRAIHKEPVHTPTTVPLASVPLEHTPPTTPRNTRKARSRFLPRTGYQPLYAYWLESSQHLLFRHYCRVMW